MKKLLLLCLLLASSAYTIEPEGFETLKKSGEWVKPQLEANKWTYPEPLLLPYGWYLVPILKNGEYRIVREQSYSGEQCIYLRGEVMADATLLRSRPSDDTAAVYLWARSEEPGAVLSFHVNLQDESGKRLDRHSASCTVTAEWKEYIMQLPIEKEVNGRQVARIAPALSSDQGVFLDDVEWVSGTADALKEAEFVDGTVLMDFDFSRCGNLSQITDKTGTYTLFSDCGQLQSENNALRVAFGARFRIPCANDAFGEKFTIMVALAKASNLERTFRAPILSRGFMQPYAGRPPEQDKFDFAFDINAYVPGFYYVEGGIRTVGVPYNQNFRYECQEHSKAEAKELFQYDRFQHLAAVYEHGAVKIYLNGVLLAENPKKIRRKLLNSNSDLYLGSFRVENEEDNQLAAEMLIESLTVIAGSAPPEKIRQAADELAARRTEPVRMLATRAYYSKEMLPCDPEMKTRLRQTERYLADKPGDPFVGNTSMSGKYEGDARSLRLLINNRSEAPIIANPHVYERREPLFNEFIADFAAASVNQVRAGCQVDEFWLAEGQYDWSKLDARLEKFIEINPNIRLVVSLGITPPQWFKENYPEELEEYYVDWRQGGLGKKKWTGYGGPMGSDKWLATSIQMVRDFVRHVESRPYCNHVYGYAISGGDANEWYWPGQFSGGLTGYSLPTLNSFRNYLRQRYVTDAEMARSWRQPGITFDQVEIPTPQKRFATENGLFRDPEKAAEIADFRRFLNERTFLNFQESCRAVRENASADRIITTYYGYSLYYAGRGLLHAAGLQTTSDVFKSPFIDSIATPIDYLRRRGGQPGVNIAGFTGAAQLYRKMIWREEDLRTHLYPRLEYGRTATLRESMEVIRRAYSYTVGENYGMYYVCQAGMHAYHQDEMMEDVARMQALVEGIASGRRIDTAEVALVFDEKESLLNLAATPSEFVTDHIWGVYQKLHTAGFPFKTYFLDDLDNDEMPDFKLYIFVNPWAINAGQREMIHRKLSKNHATAFWGYAPGYLVDGKFDLGSMRQLTSITFEEQRKRSLLQSTGSSDAPLGRLAGSEHSYAFSPVFFALPDSTVTVLASADGKAVAASTDTGRFTSIWSLLPPAQDFLTALAEQAGVHVYSQDGAMLLANDSYVVIHGVKAGRHVISLPQAVTVQEMISGLDFGRTASVEDHLEYPGQTRIYRLGKDSHGD